jgi:hypothetical protein
MPTSAYEAEMRIASICYDLLGPASAPFQTATTYIIQET